jgi:F-type H+-transporting ATPase subunit delta
MAKEYKNIGVAYVKTAAPINDAQKQKIETRLLEVSKYETFEMNFEVDENLIGGMVIRIGDRVLDDSIRTKMDDMTLKLKKVRLG